ncbi:MAG: hypothetical protein JO132_04500 [Streptosporangiaceae bacterium]|nr:hypothetical protein [Streptosporangiaceae bacterium]
MLATPLLGACNNQTILYRVNAEVKACPCPDRVRSRVLVGDRCRGGRSVTTYDAHIFRMRDGKVTDFWNGSTDQYAFDELIG